MARTISTSRSSSASRCPVSDADAWQAAIAACSPYGPRPRLAADAAREGDAAMFCGLCRALLNGRQAIGEGSLV
jgi:hypothetical protein